MKKLGLLIFAAAIIMGVVVSSLFSFGKADYKVFNFSINKKVHGSGNVKSESRNVNGFKGVDVSGIFEVEITSQQDFAVEVQADDNLLPLIRTDVRNGVLHIEMTEQIKSSNGMKIRISAPAIESIQASGASRVGITGVKNETIRVDSSGASKIELSGEAAELDIEVSGASSINAENLKATNADVNASGASRVSVFAVDELRADASGASRVSYSGNPRNVVRNSSGASSVRAN